jgi:hypothetical protein
MKKTVWTGAIALVMALTGMAPKLAALQGDNITFTMVKASEASCLASNAGAIVTVSDLGPVQNMHIEVVGLTPNTSFTTFITQHPVRPFGFSWYQGEIQTDKQGKGVADYTGIFSEETFLLSPDGPVQMDHLGIWFADANDAAKAGCSGAVTPFDGDHSGGILVLSTANSADARGPLVQLKESEVE